MKLHFWFSLKVWLIINNLDFDTASSVQHFQRVPFLDHGMSDAELEDIESPRVFKTHLPIEYLPEDFQNKSKVQSFNLQILYTIFHFSSKFDTCWQKNMQSYKKITNRTKKKLAKKYSFESKNDFKK